MSQGLNTAPGPKGERGIVGFPGARVRAVMLLCSSQ